MAVRAVKPAGGKRSGQACAGAPSRYRLPVATSKFSLPRGSATGKITRDREVEAFLRAYPGQVGRTRRRSRHGGRIPSGALHRLCSGEMLAIGHQSAGTQLCPPPRRVTGLDASPCGNALTLARGGRRGGMLHNVAGRSFAVRFRGNRAMGGTGRIRPPHRR